jgi:hypothetical protein
MLPNIRTSTALILVLACFTVAVMVITAVVQTTQDVYASYDY